MIGIQGSNTSNNNNNNNSTTINNNNKQQRSTIATKEEAEEEVASYSYVAKLAFVWLPIATAFGFMCVFNFR